MKYYTMYVCETCGYESRNVDDMEEHEAGHLGLTVSELHEYRALKSFAEYTGKVLYSTNNENTRATFDRAIENLLAFEEAHSIIG